LPPRLPHPRHVHPRPAHQPRRPQPLPPRPHRPAPPAPPGMATRLGRLHLVAPPHPQRKSPTLARGWGFANRKPYFSLVGGAIPLALPRSQFRRPAPAPRSHGSRRAHPSAPPASLCTDTGRPASSPQPSAGCLSALHRLAAPHPPAPEPEVALTAEVLAQQPT